MLQIMMSGFDTLLRTASKRLGGLAYRQKAEAVAAVAPFAPTLPLNHAGLPASLRSFFQETVAIPPVPVYTLDDVFVSWHTAVFRNFRVFLPALAMPGTEYHYSDRLLLKQWVGHTRRVRRPLGLVHDPWSSSNFYHWMADSLPRLLVLREQHPGCQLLMPAPVAGYMQQTCAALGFTDLLTVEKDDIIHADTLVVPAHTTPLGYQHPPLLKQVRDELVAALAPAVPGRPPQRRRVYVSRARQKLRRLVNEDEILPLLAQYGFETVFFEELSLTQQVRLMQETAVLLGVHGAGLTNMLFLPAGATVIEMVNLEKLERTAEKGFENILYFRMAGGLQLPYYCLPGQHAGAGIPTNDSDIRVEPAQLAQVLSEL